MTELLHEMMAAREALEPNYSAPGRMTLVLPPAVVAAAAPIRRRLKPKPYRGGLRRGARREHEREARRRKRLRAALAAPADEVVVSEYATQAVRLRPDTNWLMPPLPKIQMSDVEWSSVSGWTLTEVVR